MCVLCVLTGVLKPNRYYACSNGGVRGSRYAMRGLDRDDRFRQRRQRAGEINGHGCNSEGADEGGQGHIQCKSGHGLNRLRPIALQY